MYKGHILNLGRTMRDPLFLCVSRMGKKSLLTILLKLRAKKCVMERASEPASQRASNSVRGRYKIMGDISSGQILTRPIALNTYSMQVCESCTYPINGESAPLERSAYSHCFFCNPSN